jgi:hypothetical protein
MKRVLLIGSIVLAALSAPAARLHAQIFNGMGDATPGDDVVSFGVLFGQMNPQTKFRDGGSFGSSTLMGASLAFWVHRYFGVQLSASGTEHEGLPASDGRSSIVSERDPKIWTTMIDAVVRYPALTGSMFSVSPYLALGGGWKSYMWAFDPQGGPDARGFDLAWSYAGGVDLRVGASHRFGVRAEYRDLRTPIQRWGEKLTHQDRVLAAGLLMHF